MLSDKTVYCILPFFLGSLACNVYFICGNFSTYEVFKVRKGKRKEGHSYHHPIHSKPELAVHLLVVTTYICTIPVHEACVSIDTFCDFVFSMKNQSQSYVLCVTS